MTPSDQQIWKFWNRSLHRWGVQNLVASVLEAFGPLSILGAQFVYISQPLLSTAVPADHLEALARLLEDPLKSHAFATYLREVSSE
jgi:hypothetical protein